MAQGYAGQAIQKLRIEPPNKFSGKEDFDRFLKRTTNYMCLSDSNYSAIFEALVAEPKREFEEKDYDVIDRRLQMAQAQQN